jgi:hypothetical protein
MSRGQLIFFNLLVSVVCSLFDSTEFLRALATEQRITAFDFWVKCGWQLP